METFTESNRVQAPLWNSINSINNIQRRIIDNVYAGGAFIMQIALLIIRVTVILASCIGL